MKMKEKSFNSILVRLKARRRAEVKRLMETFQFHTGSIKSNICLVEMLTSRKFQFHTGSIKSEMTDTRAVNLSIVSIPYWFD